MKRGAHRACASMHPTPAARSMQGRALHADREQSGLARWPRMEGPCGLTFELTRARRLAKPAVARRVQRRVGRRKHLNRHEVSPFECGCDGDEAALRRRRLPQRRVARDHQEAMGQRPPQKGQSRCATQVAVAYQERCHLDSLQRSFLLKPPNVLVHPPAEAGEARCSRSGATKG